ncbi:MAG: phenylacetate--CoA ligase family protein, partial [Thermodesulfobacteriota bacterium]|nr:phenylacetate--CoA ligase family protein [Thermodesulfobacteriota bacterium]
ELGDEYEVTVTKKGDTDDIFLKVELQPEAETLKDQVLPQLVDQLRNKTNLRYNITFHPYGTLPRYDVKAKRFKDLRKDH